MHRLFVIILAAATLGGCAQGWDAAPPMDPPGGTNVLTTGSIATGKQAAAASRVLRPYNADGALPPFASSGEPAAYEYLSGYRVGAGDRLAIRVMGQPELTGAYVVDPAGNLSMPLINTFAVAGLSTREIERLITSKLKNGYLRNPAVSVQPVTLRPFYILGEVRQAGSYPYQPGMTVQNAIAIARGYTERADQRRVLLTRRTEQGTKTFKVPLTTRIFPGDIIYVRERWF